MPTHKVVVGEPVKFEDKSTVVHTVFGVHEVQATLSDGTKGTGCHESKSEAENRAYFHAKERQERD